MSCIIGKFEHPKKWSRRWWKLKFHHIKLRIRWKLMAWGWIKLHLPKINIESWKAISAKEIVETQPMSGESGLLFEMEYRFKDKS